nr:hypothetical protein 32 [bacterium]
MSAFYEKVDVSDFSIEKIDTSEIDRVIAWLPVNGVIDVNLAEQGLIHTLSAQNFCQDKILLIDRWIGYLESEKNKAWSKAALDKAKEAGHKTIKLKEWYAQADEEYIEACNQLTLAKACKKWFENKASYFSAWHYSFKTFLRRDYEIEKLSNIGYNIDTGSSRPVRRNQPRDNDFGGEYSWENEQSDGSQAQPNG